MREGKKRMREERRKERKKRMREERRKARGEKEMSMSMSVTFNPNISNPVLCNVTLPPLSLSPLPLSLSLSIQYLHPSLFLYR